MVTTRQSARIARQNGNTLPEEVEEEEDAEPQPTHTTSLTPKELRLIHQLCRYQSKNPHHSFKPELKRHLYRFACFMPAPHTLRTPSAWNHSSWRDPPDSPLPTAVAKALVLLSRPGALTPIPAPPEPPTPPALPQRQSPLFSVLPPEIRSQIFELVVTLPTRKNKARVQCACCSLAPRWRPQRHRSPGTRSRQSSRTQRSAAAVLPAQQLHLPSFTRLQWPEDVKE